MSKGSPIVQLRVPAKILQVMDEVIARANLHRFDDDWTRSSFVVSAIKDKLDKMERSRARRKKLPVAADLVEPGDTLS